jgi:signal peptide peptidase SppA
MENKESLELNNQETYSSCSSKNSCKMTNFLKKISQKLCCKNKKPIVAVVTLSGIIGKDSKINPGLNSDATYPLLKKAFGLKNVKAVALNINSPGGSPVQSEIIYNQIRQLSAEKKVPVYSFAQDLAASGGYWLLCAADEMYAHNSSIIGSIGVVFSSFGFVELIKKIGVTRRVHSEGKNKVVVDPFLEEDQESIKILKEVQKDVFESFKNLVRQRRSNSLKASEDELFNGAFWSGKKAVELGLIDGIADMRAKMTEKFGQKVEIINITTKKGLLKNLFSEKLAITSQNFLEILINNIEEKINFNKFGR